MITFTIPQEIRDFIRGNQRVCYSAMFKASSKSIKKLAKDPKFIGGDLVGFFGVLHTWGRLQQYHPHIHYIAPGGAVSDGKWLASRVDFFLPVHALSKIYKAKFKHEMDKAGLLKFRKASGKKAGTSTPRPYRLKNIASSILPPMSSGLPFPTLESSRSRIAVSFSSTAKKGHAVCAQPPSM